MHLASNSPFEIRDPRFLDCIFAHESVQKLWTGGRWCEGPAWFAAHASLVWSDIPNNRIMRWDERNNVVGEFRKPSNNTNGNALDREGRLISCEHLSRSVTRTEHDGSRTVLADAWKGKRLNSPNDVVVHSDGGIWFTDPNYGILSDYEGQRAESEIGGCHVYRIDPFSRQIELKADDFDKPNGLAFSPDESILYIADSGASHCEEGPRHIRKFAVNANRLQDLGVFAVCGNGLFDGFRIDVQGRLWCSAADGVHVFHPDGTWIGKICIPEIVANICFGGEKRNRLLICATTSLYSVYLNTTGLA
jgi:gluconolactonase